MGLRCHDDVILSWGTSKRCSIISWENDNPKNDSIGLRPKRAVICSISHAWEAREHPDPCGHQLPGMRHALEYVIQNAIFIYFHANPEVFRQADWWVKAQVPEGANHPYTILYSRNFFFVFGIWVGSCWTLKAWYIRSVVCTPFFSALE